MLSSHQQKLLRRRQLHARDLLHVLWDHYKVHLADLSLVSVVVDVTNGDVVTYIEEEIYDLVWFDLNSKMRWAPVTAFTL